MGYGQAKWDEPPIIELSKPGKVGFHTLSSSKERDAALESIPLKLRRATPLLLPEVSEIEVVRHFTRLSQENFGVDLGLYPLGSCTMKYNPKLCDLVAASHKIQELHPYQDLRTVQGILQILYEAANFLANIVGMQKITLQPAAGAHGEFTGVMLIRAYHPTELTQSEMRSLSLIQPMVPILPAQQWPVTKWLRFPQIQRAAWTRRR